VSDPQPATSSSSVVAASREGYEHFRRAGLRELQAGRLAEALQSYDSMLACARGLGDHNAVDLAFCNRSAIAIALGDVDGPLPELRAILVRNLDTENCAFAAYHIARAYELRKEPKKSLFYARIARDRAEQLAHPQRLAAANNQIGNALLADSFFVDAAESYRRALALVPAGLDDWQLICLANLAYCELVMERYGDALGRLYHVLRTARRIASPRLEMIARVDLCFAHLDLGRYATAERHGTRGLALAEAIGEVDWIKNALYLLGEVAVLAGRREQARERFTDLQGRFFPQRTSLPELLLGVDVRKVINLRA
jgi:tetratricopeptide (TPR) repeat protein